MGDGMKRLKQRLALLFSICAVIVYVMSKEVPITTVSTNYQGNMMLFKVNESYEVYMEPVSVVCVDTIDCILKSYPLLVGEHGILPDNMVIEELLLEEGNLRLQVNPSFLSLEQKKKQEAFLWYLLQFQDVKKVKIYVDDVEWEIPVLYDSEKVISSNFKTYTGDLYLGMPMVLFQLVDGYEQIVTIRVPYTDRIEEKVQWLLYVYQENIEMECMMEDKKLTVELVGAMHDLPVLQSLVYSLLVLEEVDEVQVIHEGIVVKELHQQKMYFVE